MEETEQEFIGRIMEARSKQSIRHLVHKVEQEEKRFYGFCQEESDSVPYEIEKYLLLCKEEWDVVLIMNFKCDSE